MGYRALPCFFSLESCKQPTALVIVEPLCITWPVAEENETRESQQHRRNGFDDEHPVPPTQAQPAIDSQEYCRDWRPKEARYRDRHCKQSDNASAVLGRKPIGQIQDHAREKACLGRTEK